MLQTLRCLSKWGITVRDIWFPCVMVQGSCQIGRVVGTPPSPPPSPESSRWHSGRETIFGVFKLDFDSYESSRTFDTGVLHRKSSRIDLAEWFGLGSHFGINAYLAIISKTAVSIVWGKHRKFKIPTKHTKTSKLPYLHVSCVKKSEYKQIKKH